MSDVYDLVHGLLYTYTITQHNFSSCSHGQEKGGDRKRAPVLEQMTLWLFGPGLVGLAGMRRFNR